MPEIDFKDMKCSCGQDLSQVAIVDDSLQVEEVFTCPNCQASCAIALRRRIEIVKTMMPGIAELEDAPVKWTPSSRQ
ncbi:MAG: hypothetical protein HQ530_01350 [Parcubacteria group bacterium]|nr:hypothetical protein [Parcubacteria group bacterium]